MLYGYIRVSTGTQAMHGYSLQEQREALINAGVEANRIFEDAGRTGTNFQREGWINLTKAVREGDSIVCYSMDRIGRNFNEIVLNMNALEKNGINIKTIRENVNTETAAGRMQAQIFSAVAEMEHALILERTAAGREAAKRSGKVCNRPKTYTMRKARKALEYREQGWTIDDIAVRLKTSHACVYRMMADAKKERENA